MITAEKGTVNIRPMTPSDIHAVMALDREIGSGCGLLSYADMGATERGGRLDLNFVAEVDSKIVGFIMSRLVYLMIPFTEVCVIQGIFVHPKHQERNIGSKLLQGLLGHCQAEGINTIRALIPEHNIELRQFAERHGFRRSNIINFDKTFES